MKAKFLITAITLLLVCSLQQAYSQSPVYVGFKGGISIPNLTSGSAQSDWDEGYSSRIGPNVGVLAEFQFSPLFSIQPEVNYIGEGGKRNGIQPFSIPDEYVAIYQQAFQTDKDYTYADFNNVSRINYIQIPVMAKVNFPLNQNGTLKFFAQVGPYVSFLVSAKQIIKSNDFKVYTDIEGKNQVPAELVSQFFGTKLDTTVDAKNELYKTNVGVQGGVGLSLDYGPGKFFIEGGGNYGFIKIQKGNKHGKNNIGAGTIALGYAIDIRKFR